MKQYLNLMQDILDHGRRKENRTGMDTISLFGTQMRFNLADGFPLVTTKKTHLKSIIYELLWFMRGRNDVKWLNDRGVTIWDNWQCSDGTIGPGYGVQWRYWNGHMVLDADGEPIIVQPGIDQLQVSLDKLKTNPNCRRNIVSSWNVAHIHKMALAPCHLLYQFDVTDNQLSCQMYQRSCDFFLGVPFNIASYALLTMMMARMSNLELGDFIWTGGDTHLYVNHLDQAKIQLSRDPRSLPTMDLKDRDQGLDDWEYDDFTLLDYDPHPSIKAKVSI